MNGLSTMTSRIPDPKATEDLDTPYPRDPRPLDPATIIREKTLAESTIPGAVSPSPLIDPSASLTPNVLTPADQENRYQGGDTPYPQDEPAKPDYIAEPIATPASATPLEMSPASSPLPRSGTSSYFSDDLSALSSGPISSHKLSQLMEDLRVEKIKREIGSFSDGSSVPSDISGKELRENRESPISSPVSSGLSSPVMSSDIPSFLSSRSPANSGSLSSPNGSKQTSVIVLREQSDGSISAYQKSITLPSASALPSARSQSNLSEPWKSVKGMEI